MLIRCWLSFDWLLAEMAAMQWHCLDVSGHEYPNTHSVFTSRYGEAVEIGDPACQDELKSRPSPHGLDGDPVNRARSLGMKFHPAKPGNYVYIHVRRVRNWVLTGCGLGFGMIFDWVWSGCC